MTLNPELVTVIAGGEFDMWERVEVSYSLKDCTRSFRLETAEPPGAWFFPPGTPLTILANGSLVLTGYVNRYKPQGDARSHNPVVEGRGKGQDFVDCAAVYEPGFWENKTPDEIAQDLDRFGIGLDAEVPLEPIPYFQINQGETAFAAVERALRPQGATMSERPDGSIAITNAQAAGRHAGGLIEGRNIKAFQGVLSDENRHSEIEVKGQARKGVGDAALRIAEKAMDAGVQRYRPKIIINEGDTDIKRARARANHERDRRQGLSVSAAITTQGWRDDAGALWERNWLVWVQSPSLKIAGDMLIESVTLTQDNGREGSIARLNVVNARAYQGSGGTSSSDGAWT